MTVNNSPIVARVCKSSAYSVNRFEKGKDLTCAKITNIHEDGTRSNELIAMENYKQPWWLIKEARRKFKQPKDYIEQSWVREYKTPRSMIPFEVKKQLFGAADRQANMYDILSGNGHQFVFGVDQTPPVHLKYSFFKQYREHQEKEAYTVAAYDVETDMYVPGEPIIMAATTFKRKAYLAIVRSWFKGASDHEILTKLKEAEDQFLRVHLDQRDCEVEYELFDTPGQVAEGNLKRFHSWDPDWVLSWNASFDMEKTEEALKNDGYNLPRVYSAPSIPKEYAHYEYNKGRTHKVKENGDKSPLEPQEKWPSVRTMAGYQWADAMSGFGIKRGPGGKLDAYGLQAIADHLEVEGKLYGTAEVDAPPGDPQWHREMQKYYPYQYCMYCINDNFAIERIDEKTKDFSLSIPMLLRYSEYFNFVSQPKLISDTLSFVAYDNGYVWGSTPVKRDKTFTSRLPGLGDWIALLDTEKNATMGVAIFEGLFDVFSSGRSDTADIDVEGAYPTATLSNNAGNKTTMMETWAIQGAGPSKLREIAINYTSSPVANAISLCHDLFRFPLYDNMVEVFEKKMESMGNGDMLARLREQRAAMLKLRGTPVTEPDALFVEEEEIKKAA